MILSLYPGIGLLDKGFENEGFCVVRGPDLIFGGDIREFNVPAGKFDGVIGGSPCPDFSRAKRLESSGLGLELLNEYKRVVEQAKPNWWLLENVKGVPDLKINGYNWQRLDIRASDFGSSQRRLRHVQFGSNDDTQLFIDRKHNETGIEATCLANDDRSFDDLKRLQDLPVDFDIPSFTRGALTRAIGNGVPFSMAKALATAVKNRQIHDNLCACFCGRKVSGRKIYSSGACRKRVYDRKIVLLTR